MYGAAYDSQYTIRHILVEKEDDLSQLQGAKYAQSSVFDIFKTLKSQLDTGRQVLFSGTPCQVAGLKSYLQRDYYTLICIDFICHGVPSPMAWNKYVEYRSEQDNQGILPSYINLRSKESGWSRWSYSTLFEYDESNRYICKNSDDIYMKLFVGNYILRESCEHCHFKGYVRSSDITLGDFWGVWDIAPQLDDDRGTSVLLIHTVKGETVLSQIAKDLVIQPVTLKEASMLNSSLVDSVTANSNRSSVLEQIRNGGFSAVIETINQEYQQQKMESLLVKVKQKLGRKVFRIFS